MDINEYALWILWPRSRRGAIFNRVACTDHLLPKGKYPQLRDTSMMNAVAAFPNCNGAKHAWDPNHDGTIYTGGDLTYDMRLGRIERVREHIALRRTDPRRVQVLDGLAKARMKLK